MHSTHEWSGSAIELSEEYRSNDVYEYEQHPVRVVSKNGEENVVYRRVPEKPRRYLRDLITTLIELDWKYMLAMFLASYLLNWLLFATLSYAVAYAHGDMADLRHQANHKPCIIGVTNYLGMFIYSIEIQTTVGFGEKYPTEECVGVIFFYIMQIICSIGIEGAMVSVIYWKTARPAKQMTKLKFSEKAVICYRDNKLCLLFRVCDPRKQQTISTKVRLYMIADRVTPERETLKSHTELNLLNNGELLIEWPEIVCHVIDATSPLRHYARSAKMLQAANVELYVSIVGTSSSSAMLTEARTSYIPQEIIWGQRFINIIYYDLHNERYEVDYSQFNTTIAVDMQRKFN